MLFLVGRRDLNPRPLLSKLKRPEIPGWSALGFVELVWLTCMKSIKTTP
jgi:hypothetical protein